MSSEPMVAHEGVETQVLMRHSQSLCALAEALALAQGEFPAIEKERTAQIKSDKASYSYSYADLADILAAVRKPLSSHGLSVVQPITWAGGAPWLITRLLHSSGEWLESSYRLDTYERPQEMGSGITYARRYALTALLGIAAEEDDDGAAAQRGAKETATKAPCPKCKDGRKVIKSKYGPGLYCLACKVNFPDPAENGKVHEPEVIETSDGRTFEVDATGQLDAHKPALPADGSPAWKDPMALAAECVRLSAGNKDGAAELLAQITGGKRTVKGMSASEVLAGWSHLADVLAVRA